VGTVGGNTGAVENQAACPVGGTAAFLPGRQTNGTSTTPLRAYADVERRECAARALVNRPSLLLADEPTGNLDTATSMEILDLLVALNRDQGVTILLITHEPDIAARASRQLTLCDGVLTG